ncbi:MAG TPA: hypothetical protein VFV11_09460 [Solimonas sp.]|nr:hypothetical protein [Solimonas sp.]
MTYLQRTLAFSLMLSFFYGLFAPLAEHKTGQALLSVAGFVIAGTLITYWLRRDNERLSIRWSKWRLFLMVLTPISPFAFLWYFITSRGVALGTVAFVGLLALSFGCLGMMFGGAYVSYALVS